MGTVTLTGLSAGLASGEKIIGPVTYTGTTPGVGEIIDSSLASGDNDFAVPPGASFLVLFLGSSPGVTVKVRTNLNSGDAGLPVAPYGGSGFVAFPLASGVTTVILNASAGLTGIELSFI